MLGDQSLKNRHTTSCLSTLVSHPSQVDKSVVDAALKAAAVSATDKILEIGPGTGFLTTSLVASGAEVLAVEKALTRNPPTLGTPLTPPSHPPRTFLATIPTAAAANVTTATVYLRVSRVPFFSASFCIPHPLSSLFFSLSKDHVLAEKLLGTFEGVPRLRLIVDDVLRWLKKAPEAKTEFPAMADQGALRAKVVANLPYNITTDTLKRLLPMGDSFSTVVLLVQEEARYAPR